MLDRLVTVMVVAVSSSVQPPFENANASTADVVALMLIKTPLVTTATTPATTAAMVATTY